MYCIKPDLMFVLDVPLQVYFLSECLATLVAMVLSHVQVNVLVPLQVAAGGSNIVTIVTIFTLVSLLTCNSSIL